MTSHQLQRAPDLMTPDERTQEIARLFARAFIRRKARDKALALSAGEPLLSTAVGQDAAPQEGEA